MNNLLITIGMLGLILQFLSFQRELGDLLLS